MLRAKGLYKSYTMGRTAVPVLRGATLAAEEGEFLAVMGASGSGKSTLLHLLGGLDVPDRGTVVFNGRDVFGMSDAARRAYRNRNIGLVFQFYHLLPECNVLENIVLPRLVGHSAWAWRFSRRGARRDAQELMDRVRLTDRARHRPSELSGGERQRVAIARALINRPQLLLADEPTGNLDAKIGGGILRLLAEFNETGQTIVMVTHDPRVASHATRCIQLGDGVVREAETPGDQEAAVRLMTKEVAP